MFTPLRSSLEWLTFHARWTYWGDVGVEWHSGPPSAPCCSSVSSCLYVEVQGLMKSDTQARERGAWWACSCATSQINLRYWQVLRSKNSSVVHHRTQNTRRRPTVQLLWKCFLVCGSICSNSTPHFWSSSHPTGHRTSFLRFFFIDVKKTQKNPTAFIFIFLFSDHNLCWHTFFFF